MNYQYHYPNDPTPTCHLQHKEDEFIATIEMPGINKGDISISFSEDDGGIGVSVKEDQRYFLPLQSSTY